MPVEVSDYLLQRIAAGEMPAMQECIETYGGLVWSLARRFSATPAEAEDGVQEVFIALWEHAGRFDPERGAEATFVSMIARRRLIDRGRKHERQQRLIADVRALKEPEPADTTRPAQTLDEVNRAGAALEELSENQRRVLRLAIHHGLTHEQISTHTGLPLGTVKTHARRGLIRVREMLQEAEADVERDQSIGSEA